MFIKLFLIIATLLYLISILIPSESFIIVDNNSLSMAIESCDDDRDCASWEICRNYQCYDGCIDSRCGYNARCLPANHTYSCKCFDDLDGDPYTKCVRKCSDNSHCNDHQFCKDNMCVYACNYIKCATNALCTANNHSAICQCKFCSEGDANIECIKKKTGYCKEYYY